MNRKTISQPCAILGAGPLVSHLHRAEREEVVEYGFNLLRVSETLESSHLFRPQDLRDIVKLCQVIAYAIEDDGWITPELRMELNELFESLDAVTRTWDNESRRRRTE